MKYLRKLNLFVIACMTVALVSCGGLISGQDEFDKTMLVGKWVNDSNSQEYYVFEDTYTGYTWDEGEDVYEEDACCDLNCMFAWSMLGSELTIIYSTTMTGEGSIPKLYTLSKLTDTELVYYDLFKKVSFTKVY